MGAMIPKRYAPGADFCGVDEYYYIVRSDLGCYMRSSHFNLGNDLEVFSLHNSCRGGDHYLADQNGSFYVIKGDDYRRVSDMSTDNDAIAYSLHPSCQGGDHYLSAFGYFYIIFQDKSIYLRVTDMHTAGGAVKYNLHPECQDGLYYWGIKNYYYFLKPKDKWGIQYVRCTNFNKNQDVVTFSFHGSVVPFIPGGLNINEGKTFGRWKAIKTICNNSDTPIVWSKKITKKVGYNKKKMSSLEHNWKINMGASYHPGALSEALVKYQLSLSVEYGGKAVQTQQEDWNEATEVEESISLTLKPGSQLYIWQYQLGFGKEPILFCRDTVFTKDSTPPTVIPLSRQNKVMGSWQRFIDSLSGI